MIGVPEPAGECQFSHRPATAINASIVVSSGVGLPIVGKILEHTYHRSVCKMIRFFGHFAPGQRRRCAGLRASRAAHALRSQLPFKASHADVHAPADSIRTPVLCPPVKQFETDEIATIISDAIKVAFKRRLADRVLRLWAEMARGQGFPRLDQIEPSKLGVDCCFVIAVRSPVSLSYFAVRGVNLSFAFYPQDSLADVLLSHLPLVLAERRCLMIEGRARLREIDIVYRSGLYQLSDDGIAIDHVLGTANYRPLRENEYPLTPLVWTKWL